MWMYKVKKCKFYVSSSSSNDLKTCSYIEFCSIFWLQALLKSFLWVRTIHTRYRKVSPRSGLYIGNKIMVIQLTNPFLFMKTFISPLTAGFGHCFFIYVILSIPFSGLRVPSLLFLLYFIQQKQRCFPWSYTREFLSEWYQIFFRITSHIS